MSFVHLHLHTQYSLLDGAIRPSDLIKKTVEFGMPAVAITDHGSMYGAVEFYTKCKDAGIKPIIGCELYVAPGSRHDRNPEPGMPSSFHLVLLAQNLAGYRNLCHLTSMGHKDGFYRRPRVDKELLKQHSEGLICLSACLQGEIPWHAYKEKDQVALEAAQWYAETFRDRFYLELQENTLNEQAYANKKVMAIARQLGLPLVATNDCHYLNREDARAHEILLCIQTGKTINDPNRMRFSADEFYFKSPDEMRNAFCYVPQAIESTLQIADMCDLKLDFKTYHFPSYEPPAGKTLDQELTEAAEAGLEKRIDELRLKGREFGPTEIAQYQERLIIELNCIKQMGFAGYFLIVADFINWAKDHDIPVGPGRGSAAGSLVAYSIRITDLDPIPYNLLFERFLNPERISMPDIDVDFCQDRREEVIQYMVRKYGADKVCQIITFGTMSARSVIRDVGRALDLSYGDVDKIAKLVPDMLGVTLKDALKQEPRLSEEMKLNPSIDELINTALRLEGLARHASTHAAGVVVSPGVLEDFCPVYKDQKTGAITTQYTMKYVEKIGLVKFDFLGLKNLTVINNAVQMVRERHDPTFDISRIPDWDEKSFALLQAGDTTGVFQLESSGMKELLVRLKPSCFEDIIAVCALYRPGPLGSGMVDDFIERKHGRKEVTYDLEQLEPILKDTYGVIVYQEQVMQIARSLAGYSLGGADLLRRAMGKKDMAQMAQERSKFLNGARDTGVDEQKAAAIFDLMAKFAEYGFNKSHSAAYALVAWQTAYLKAHYPIEFMAALLSEDMGNTDKTMKNVNECRIMEIKVAPPHINNSRRKFSVTGDTIIYGLGAVKNVGDAAIESIIQAQKDGPFESLVDFCCRVDLSKVNKKVLESLIKCGAFECTGIKRSQAFTILEAASKAGALYKKEQDSPQLSLFGGGEDGTEAVKPSVIVPDVEEWNDKERLVYEKEVIGFYITGHPLNYYAARIKHLTSTYISDLIELSDQAIVRVCGIVVGLREIFTKRGDKMAFVQLEDQSGMVELVVFSDAYKKAAATLATDEPHLVEGKLEIDGEKCKIIVNSLMPLRDIKQEQVATVRINGASANDETMSKLRSLFEVHHGPVRTKLELDTEEGKRVTMILPPRVSIKITPQFKSDLNDLLGPGALSLVTD